MSEVEFEAGGLRWRVETDAVERVREAICERLDTLEDRPGTVLIKRNLVRAVFRVPLDDGSAVVVKRYNVRGPYDWVKYTFRESRALAEWRVGRGLDAVGVPTAVPLAMAERRDPVLLDAALITREIPDARHLNAYMEEELAAPSVARAALLVQLAALVRRMHEAGFVHNDLHGGNLLVTGPAATAQIHVIDLHSVSWTRVDEPGPDARRRPSARRREFDLVKLLHSIRTCTTPEERGSVLVDYGRVSNPPSDLRMVVDARPDVVSDELETAIAALERKRVRSRTRRALTTSSQFIAERHVGARVRRRREVEAESVLQAVSAHRHAERHEPGRLLKDARRSALSRQTVRVDGEDVAAVVKQYRVRSLPARVKNLVRRPRALAAWVAGHGLAVRGFSPAEPLALVSGRLGPRLGDSYLVMRAYEDDQRLDLIALDRFVGELPAERRTEKRSLVAVVARTFRRLHREGVYHADLKAVNLFLDESATTPELVLADFDRVEFDATLPRRRRLKNLAQLSASVAICITLSDRLRFLREYLRDEPEERRRWKEWFRGVTALCERKIVVRMQPIE